MTLLREYSGRTFFFFHIHLRHRYSHAGPTFAVTEPDGVRVIGPDFCDMIQKVPCTQPVSLLWSFVILSRIVASSLSIFRPGSTAPSAILYDAWESFTQKRPKADESIRSIRPDLATAVDECIDAAGQEWESYWQRRLLSVSILILMLFPS